MMSVDTSLEAWRNVQEGLSKRQTTVYHAIRKLGSVTNAEISKYLQIPINSVTPRTGELKDLGLIVRHERRECQVTKNNAYSWRVVNA